MKLTAEQIKAAKAEGFLFNRNQDFFSGRIITENGVLNSRQLQTISEAAEKFGNGDVAFTTRLTVEVQGLPYERLKDFQQYIARDGMVTGGTGAKVRPIVACKGTVCVFGLIDTQQIATELHKRFFEGYGEVVLPHKFKIAVGGCPNNCVKPDLNDVGIVGQRVPAPAGDICRGCGKCLCVSACPMGAAKVENGKLVIDRSICSNCGRCGGKCPFRANEKTESMYRVYIGGRWGKKTRHGDTFSRLFTREEAMDMVEKAILLFKDRGEKGERFGSLIDRIGFDEAERILLSDELLRRKEEILAK